MLTIAIIVGIWRFMRKRGLLPQLYKAGFVAATMLFVIALPMNSFAAGGWELKKNSDGIKIYTRDVPGTGIKGIKADFETEGNIENLEKLLHNVSAQKDWVYSTKSSVVIKRISAGEVIYYTVKSLPWPMENRDVVMHMKTELDAANGVMTMKAKAIKGHVREQDDMTRIPLSEVSWKVTTINSHTIRIEYEAQADPGGTVPAWITNMFLTKGPLETFKKLREHLEKD